MKPFNYADLEALCKKKGITVSQAAVRAGINRTTVWHWSRGRLPGTRLLQKIISSLE